ncbi:MAG: hypothetical protein ABI706_13360 [Ilumatobacteraceae bacterium]
MSAFDNRIPTSVDLLHIVSGVFAMAAHGLFMSLHGKDTRAAFAGGPILN